MRRPQLALLARLAGQRLDERLREVREQEAAAAALKGIVDRLDAEVEAERARAGLAPAFAVLTPDWLAAQRERRAALEGDRAAAEGELAGRVDRAREAYLERRRLDRLIEAHDAKARDAAARRELALLDELAGRRRRLPSA